MNQFIPSRSFSGSKVGYYFANGYLGLGYYPDKLSQAASVVEPVSNKEGNGKRKRDEFEIADLGSGSKKGGADENLDEVLEEAEDAPITQLDATSVKQLLVNFEKKITQNQRQRIKFADTPEKFMESEFTLHKEIQNLHVIAAYPSLYPILLQTQSIASICAMITHENTDISIMTISLLQEMIDANSLAEAAEEMVSFVEAFISLQGLELITQNLMRLNEFDSNEDAQGVYNTFAILDNIVEIGNEHAVAIVKKTNIISYLTQRIGNNKEYDSNKLYASEILSILTQCASNEVKDLVLAHEDYLDSILKSIAVYRKKDLVAHSEEREYVENLFLTVNTLLMAYKGIQDLFLSLEGIELLVRCWQYGEYSALPSISTMSLALLHHPPACLRFVDLSGLKFIFSYLQLISKPGQHKYRKVIVDKQESLEESLISLLSSLCLHLSHYINTEQNKRLLAKLVERDYEKLGYVCGLVVKYRSKEKEFEIEAERVQRDLEEKGDEEALAELLDPENVYEERLEHGLFVLQQLAGVMGYVCRMHPPALPYLDRMFTSDKTYSTAISLHKLEQEHVEKYDLASVLAVLREQVKNMKEEDTEGDEKEEEDGGEKDSGIAKEKEVYITWTAVLADHVAKN